MILTALNNLYDRLQSQGEVATFGFSLEPISFALVYSLQGEPIEIMDLRDHTGKTARPVPMRVPKDPDVTRTSGIQAFSLWDKTAYSLGVSAEVDAMAEGPQREKKVKRLQEAHEAFKSQQQALLADCDEPTAVAFLTLLSNWDPARLRSLAGYSNDVLDANFVFLPDDRDRRFLHEREDAKACWLTFLEGQASASKLAPSQCAITGTVASPARLHPKISGVQGGKTTGSSLVSFNESAYLSFGQNNATTAPVSKAAVFGYTTALKHLLSRNSRQRIQIGNATAVFWAEAATPEQAHAAEDFFEAMHEPPTDEQEANRLRILLDGVANGQPLASLDPRLSPDTRFYILGLEPNSARLSVRFWLTDNLDQLTRNYVQHYRDVSLSPAPWRGIGPAIWQLVNATAPIYADKPKRDKIPPRLAGDLAQAILTGRRYPRTLLSNTLMRIRADGHITGARVALCKAVINREIRLSGRSSTEELEATVSVNNDSTNPGYLLGRLFAVLEDIQRAALGRKLNSPISDRFYGSASATPANVFAMLLRNARNHLTKMRKSEKGGLAHTLEAKMADLLEKIGDRFPRHLPLEDQGRFAIGYYHEAAPRFAGKSDAQTATSDIDDNAANQEDAE